jgi:hypothetical protein
MLGIGLHVNHLRIIFWHIDHVGFRGDDADRASFSDDTLLRGVGKVACGNCLRPKSLNGVHNIRWLIKKSVAQSRRPLEVLIHPF